MTNEPFIHSEPPVRFSIVEISYNELCALERRFLSLRHEAGGDPSFENMMIDTLVKEFPELIERLGKAFALQDSLGLLLVTGMPSCCTENEGFDYEQMRQELLREIQRLGSLPADELERLTCPEAHFQMGWSHGKEKLSNDRYDTSKGSYYFNPLVKGSLVDAIQQRDKGKMVEDDTPSTNSWLDDPDISTPNKWPTNALPGLESIAMDMGQLVCCTGNKIALLCDLYVASRNSSCQSEEQNFSESPFQLYDVLTKSLFSKGRLLHYFADNQDIIHVDSVSGEQANKASDDDWCGWHNDHGSLTGLIPAMYFDKHGKAADDGKNDDLPKNGGLYIKSRTGTVHRAIIPCPSTTLAFQVGETTQIMTGGVLQATPHAVKRGTKRNANAKNSGGNIYTRETMAVFMEPEYPLKLHIPYGKTLRDIQSAQAQGALPHTVRTLQSRYTRDGMTFGEFSKATFEAFS